MNPGKAGHSGLRILSKETDTDAELILYALGLVLPRDLSQKRAAPKTSGGRFAVMTYGHPPSFRKESNIPAYVQVHDMVDRDDSVRRLAEGELYKPVLEDFRERGIKMKPEETEAIDIQVILLPPTHLIQEHEVDVSYQPRERGTHHLPPVPVDQDARDELLLRYLNKVNRAAQVSGLDIVAPHNPQMFPDSPRLNSRMHSQFQVKRK